MPNAITWVAMGGQFGFFLLCFFGVPNSQGLTIGEQLFGYRLSQHDYNYQPKHDGSQPQVGPGWDPRLARDLTIELPPLVLAQGEPQEAGGAVELSPWFVPRHLATVGQARGRHAAPEPWDLPQGLRTV